MHTSVTPHTDLLVTVGNPSSLHVLEEPRRVRVHWRTYGGRETLVELEQIATARDVVCVRQPRGEAEPWTAWVPAAVVEPTVELAHQGEPGH